MDKWDLRYMSLALEVSTWSKDPSSQVGCIAVSPDKRSFAEGYNGFPKGIIDTDERLNNKKVKNKFMVHAEANCIVNATNRLTGWTLYVTKAPCIPCASIIAASGIVRVVCPNPGGSWEDEQIEALSLLKAAELEVDFYG